MFIPKKGVLRLNTLMTVIVILFTQSFQNVSAQAIGDYRSTGSGNWTSTSTWQKYTSSGWTTATATPTSADGVITIQTGHTVTITNGNSLTIDQVVCNGTVQINNGGSISLNDGTGVDFAIASGGALTLNNGGTFSAWTSTTTITCSGTITNNSGATFNNAATLTINSGGTFSNSGTYSHNTNYATNIYGTFNNNSGATFNAYTGGTISVSGTFNHNGSSIGSSANISVLTGGVLNMNAAISMYNTTTFSNAGTVIIASGVTFTDQGATTNSGYIKCAGYLLVNSNSGNITNTGTMRFTSTGYMLNSATFTNNSNGIIIDSSSTAPVISPNSGSSTPLIFNNNSIYYRVAAGGTVPTATWNNSSTCAITGATSAFPSGLSQSFVNFTWNCNNQSANLSLSGSFTTISGNFTVNNTGKNGSTPYELRLSDGQTLSFTVGGNMTIGAKASVVMCNSGSTTGTVSVSGNVIDSGYLYMSRGTGAVSLTLTGNLYTYNGGYSKFILAQNSANGTVKVLGNFRNAASLIFNDGSNGTTSTGNGTLTVYGNFVQASTGSMANSSTKNNDGLINFRGGSSQTFADSSLNISKVDYTIGKSTTLQLNTNMKVFRFKGLGSKHMSLSDSGTINFGTKCIVKSITAHTGGISGDRVELLDSAKVITAHSKGIYKDTTGSIRVDTLDYHNGVAITYNGTSTQTTGFHGISSLSKIYKVTFNTTGGMDTLDLKMKISKLYMNNSNGAILKDTLSISYCLYFQNGILNTGNATVKIDTNLTAAVTGQSKTAYINGPVRRWVSGTGVYAFPTGTTANYQLATVSLHSITGMKYLTSQFFTTNTGTVPSDSLIMVNGTAINTLLDGGYWIITPDVEPTGGTYDVTLNELGYTTGAASATQYTVIKRPNTSAHWQVPGTAINSTQSIGSDGTVTAVRTGLTAFSNFGIGFGNNPLPVKLETFTGTNHGSNNELNWTTASEQNTDHFEIEYTLNGYDFVYLTSVKANGNSKELLNYSYIHTNVTVGTYYYRLKSVDKDGTSSYSAIITVDVNGDTPGSINLYPNPVVNNLTIDMKGISGNTIRINIINMAGQSVHNEIVTNNAKATLNVTTLPSSEYIVVVTDLDNNTQYFSRFIK